MMGTHATALRDSPPKMTGLDEANAPSVPSHATEADQKSSEAKRQAALNRRQGCEKPACGGRPAYDVAYSIRDHLASIRMRLYSLGRLDLPADQQDDLGVIAEEIDNIDDIVRGFPELTGPLESEKEKWSIA
jgi:hypothetical protein